MSSADTGRPCIDVTFYTDPLCCWSFCLDKHWRVIQQRYAEVLTWRYCMGGLLPDWQHFRDDVYSISRPAQMGPLWMEASHLTATPLNTKLWIDNPPASSYLSCIAVKAAALQSPAAEEIFFRAAQKAVMQNARNIAYASTLLQIADELHATHPDVFDQERFARDLTGAGAIEAFQKDLDEVRRRGINRFPTLVVRTCGRDAVMMTGYRPLEALDTFFAVRAGVNSASETSSTNTV